VSQQAVPGGAGKEGVLEERSGEVEATRSDALATCHCTAPEGAGATQSVGVTDGVRE